MHASKGILRLSAGARDLLTQRDGRTEVVGTAALEATVGVMDGVLQRIDIGDTNDRRTAPLIGRLVGRGFREAVDEAMPDERAGQTLRYLLLEELPVARLISGYAALYRQPTTVSANAPVLPADICAGWAHDGTMMVAIDETGQIPVPMGPEISRDDPADPDPDAWHPMAPLPAGAMRRRRLVDVAGGDPLAVQAMFRDTHVEPGGAVTVLHEYDVRAAVDPASLEMLEATATPRVLPWPECPAAAASAGRLVGRSAHDIRTLVRQDFRGLSTCTHLNDLLRSLGDIGALSQTLRTHLAA
jgi:hypothetical protein